MLSRTDRTVPQNRKMRIRHIVLQCLVMYSFSCSLEAAPRLRQSTVANATEGLLSSLTATLSTSWVPRHESRGLIPPPGRVGSLHTVILMCSLFTYHLYTCG